MFYEERVIDGILHCRTSPDREFEPMSQFALTQKIERMEIELFQLRHRLAEVE